MDKVTGTTSAHNKSLLNVNGIFANIIFTSNLHKIQLNGQQGLALLFKIVEFLKLK